MLIGDVAERPLSLTRRLGARLPAKVPVVVVSPALYRCCREIHVVKKDAVTCHLTEGPSYSRQRNEESHFRSILKAARATPTANANNTLDGFHDCLRNVLVIAARCPEGDLLHQWTKYAGDASSKFTRNLWENRNLRGNSKATFLTRRADAKLPVSRYRQEH